MRWTEFHVGEKCQVPTPYWDWGDSVGKEMKPRMKRLLDKYALPYCLFNLPVTLEEAMVWLRVSYEQET